MKALAKLVDRDVGQISRWTKRDDWTFSRKGPWPRAQLPEILRWAAAAINPRDEGPGGDGDGDDDVDLQEMKALRKEKIRNEIRKLMATAELAETAALRELGKLLDKEAVEKEWTGVAVLIRTAFQNLGSQLVPMALSHGMPLAAAPAFQQKVEEAVAAVLRYLSKDGAAPSEAP